MGDASTSLTPVQMEIMREVWDRGTCTVSDVWHALQEQREVARNTVLTLIQRLEQRGWLESEARGRTFVYRACVSREAAQRRHLSEVVEHVFDGSAEDLVRSLLGGRMVKKAEITRLRGLLEAAEKKGR